MANTSSVQRAIQIYARLKPVLHRQTANYEVLGADSSDEEYLTIAVKQNPEDGYINNKPEQHSFRFSKVFDRACSQESVFQDVAKPVVDSALMGYNGTIFAYGQTGSGKTFTMTGSRSEYDKRGIIPRALSYVFKNFQQDPDTSKIRSAFVSYLEIYNEGGYDLLHSSDMAGRLEDLGKVTLLEDGHQQMHLRNLSVHPISSEEEALQLLYLGDHNRTVAETPLNEASTRSHCIFTIHLNIREANTSIVRRSKLHLVDLAGSERVSNSAMSGQLLTEARHINLALHYLEQVIVALSDSNRQHIPYRNSMMTSVLRDSLGGNCMTSMIATLSLEPFNVMESLSTCRFSQRVAMVTNAAMPNEELDPNLVIQQLKAEVKKLRETMASASIKPVKETAQPLTMQEYGDCSELVERFLMDPDQNAILAVPPDMRMIQTCFRLLRTSKNTKSGLPAYAGASNRTVSTVPNDQFSSRRNQADMSCQELLQTINRRDIEIKVLVEMLRKEKMRRGAGSRESLENGSYPTAQSDCDSLLNIYNTNAGSKIYARNPFDKIGEPPGDELVEMSDVKKLALSEFLETYEEKGKLEAIRNEILRKREEVESLEKTLNNNESSIGSLADIYNRTKEEGLSEESENIKTALESQQRTCSVQLQRLQTAQKELDAQHETLRVLYQKLMIQFDKWWQTAASHKPLERQASTVKAVTSVLKQPTSFGIGMDNKKSYGPPASKSPVPSYTGSSPIVDIPSKSNNAYYHGLEHMENKGSTPSGPPPSPWSTNDIVETSDIVSADVEDSERENQSLLLTGDPSTDQEILKFFEARKKAAMKIKQSISTQK